MAHRTQSQHLESIQKRALRIIFNFTRGFPYSSILFVAGWNSLEDRRHNLSRSFFQSISEPDSCHYLSPPLRDTSLITVHHSLNLMSIHFQVIMFYANMLRHCVPLVLDF